ncbi:MAG: hypothetical protein WBX25_08095 [Rhodomicrobium sp.]
MRNLIRPGLALVMATTFCACGSTGTENATLLSQPLRSGAARVQIVRPQEFLAALRDARIKVDGKKVADLTNGSSTTVDIAAGSHDITVDVWDSPSTYKMKLDAKPGTLYTLEVTVRREGAAVGMLGAAGALADAATNENGGLFQIRVISDKPI